VELSFALAPLLRGRAVMRRALVVRPRLLLFRRSDGASNFVDLLQRESRRPTGAAGGRGARLLLLEVRGGQLELVDAQHDLELVAQRVDGQVAEGRAGSFSLAGVTVAVPQLPDRASFARIDVALPRDGRARPSCALHGGAVRLLPHLLLSGIEGQARYAGGRVVADASGSYGGATATLWAAAGWFSPAERRGRLELKAARFRLDRIASILKTTPVIRPQSTTIDGRLSVRFERERVDLSGNLAVADLSLFHPRLAYTPVLGLSLTAQLAAQYRRDTRTLTLEQLKLRFRGVEGKLQGTVARVGKQPLIALRLQIPPVPCQAILEAIPPSLVPKLQGFALKGDFAVDLSTRVDYANLDATELDGSVGIRRCTVVSAPDDVSAERLKAPFEHIVESAPGQMLTIVVGPDNPDFVPLAQISPHAISAFLTTEDAGFFRHRGFLPSQFRAALARNLQHGGFRLGASTISMQMVKNVLLSHEKTLSRKLQELFLTWYLEQELTKERVIEIYLNAIEFGPGIYGIGAAHRHYFARGAQNITPLQAAFYSSILPSPKRRHAHYCRGELSPQWDTYVRRILKRMYGRGHLTDAQYAAAQKEQIAFFRDKSTLSEADCLQQIKDLTEAWSEEADRRLREAVRAAAPHQLELYLPKR
jgi:hypothetical protein